jgi:hypothetical protein
MGDMILKFMSKEIKVGADVPLNVTQLIKKD